MADGVFGELRDELRPVVRDRMRALVLELAREEAGALLAEPCAGEAAGRADPDLLALLVELEQVHGSGRAAAKALGISRGAWSRWRRGRAAPTKANRRRLQRAATKARNSERRAG